MTGAAISVEVTRQIVLVGEEMRGLVFQLGFALIAAIALALFLGIVLGSLIASLILKRAVRKIAAGPRQAVYGSSTGEVANAVHTEAK